MGRAWRSSASIAARRAAVGAAILLIAGCSSAADRAASAAAQGQAALNDGNLGTAREAFSLAVQARDDDAQTWRSLGAVQLQLRRYADAFYAYSRAAELDQGDAQARRVLAQIALVNDQLDEASRMADQLDLLQPNNFTSILINGYIALKRGRYEEAERRADAALAQAPTTADATILKARALEGQNRAAAAVELLEKAAAAQSSDVSVLSNLLGVYQRKLDKAGVARTLGRLTALTPDNEEMRFQLAQALFEAGRLREAESTSRALARSARNPQNFTGVLKLWLAYRPRSAALADVRALTPGANRQRRLDIARFLIEAGAPAKAERLLEADVTKGAGATTAKAVMGHAQAALGRNAEAEATFREVLRFDDTNIAALRGRVDLDLATNRLDAALADAQRLVTENPKSAEDRLRLVAVYKRRKDDSLARSALWQAFNDVPASPLLFARLRESLQADGRTDEISRLRERFIRQQRLVAEKAVTF